MKKIFLGLALLFSVAIKAQSPAGSIDYWINSYTKGQFPKNNLVQQLGKIIGFNMNSTADQLITLVGGTKFIVTDVIIINASTSLTTAEDFQVQDAILRGGNLICNSNVAGGPGGDVTLSSLTSASKFINSTVNLILNGTNINNSPALIMNVGQVTVGNSLYASLGTAQGSTTTADIYVWGYILQ